MSLYSHDQLGSHKSSKKMSLNVVGYGNLEIEEQEVGEGKKRKGWEGIIKGMAAPNASTIAEAQPLTEVNQGQ